MGSYNSVINACAQAGDAERAESWLVRMQKNGLTAGTHAYNTLINACAKAEKWMKRMQKIGISADVVSFGTMIDACARVGDADKAEFWLGELVRSGSKPSPGSYGVLLR